jgi:hypothetical protein
MDAANQSENFAAEPDRFQVTPLSDATNDFCALAIPDGALNVVWREAFCLSLIDWLRHCQNFLVQQSYNSSY